MLLRDVHLIIPSHFPIAYMWEIWINRPNRRYGPLHQRYQDPLLRAGTYVHDLQYGFKIFSESAYLSIGRDGGYLKSVFLPIDAKRMRYINQTYIRKYYRSMTR